MYIDEMIKNDSTFKLQLSTLDQAPKKVKGGK
jgi:hypothetical protein